MVIEVNLYLKSMVELSGLEPLTGYNEGKVQRGGDEVNLKTILLVLLLPVLMLLLAACGGESTKEKCDPAYPPVCISPPPPDLDCGEISYRRFEVLRPDPQEPVQV